MTETGNILIHDASLFNSSTNLFCILYLHTYWTCPHLSQSEGQGSVKCPQLPEHLHRKQLLKAIPRKQQFMFLVKSSTSLITHHRPWFQASESCSSPSYGHCSENTTEKAPWKWCGFRYCGNIFWMDKAYSIFILKHWLVCTQMKRKTSQSPVPQHCQGHKVSSHVLHTWNAILFHSAEYQTHVSYVQFYILRHSQPHTYSLPESNSITLYKNEQRLPQCYVAEFTNTPPAPCAWMKLACFSGQLSRVKKNKLI